jgi:2-haloalkanoic acid dehalogenase type II
VARRIEAVLFDLGGTLIHFAGAWPEVMQSANQELVAHLQSEGFELEPESFVTEFRSRLEHYYAQRESEFIEHTTAYLLRTLLNDLGYPDVTSEMMRPALQRLYSVSQAHWQAEDDTLSTLQALRAAGYKMGIVSNAGDDADVQTLVDKTGLRDYFDFVLSSAACGIRKPNPRIFEIALENWGLPAARTAMVGDTLGADVLGARNAGVFSIWITRRADTPANRDHEDTIEPDATIATLADLPGLLAAHNSA